MHAHYLLDAASVACISHSAHLSEATNTLDFSTPEGTTEMITDQFQWPNSCQSSVQENISYFSHAEGYAGIC